MAFGRINVIVPALAVLTGLFGAYKLWRSFYKDQSTIDEQVQDEAIGEIIVEEAKENLDSADVVEDEYTSASPLNVPTKSSPSSTACSASSLALFQTNLFGEKKEEFNEIISSRSSSTGSKPTNAAGSNSISSISQTSRLTITDLSSSGTTVSQELKNELKMEIENMKTQLCIYSEAFIGLQMGRQLSGGTYGTVYEAHARLQKIAVKLLVSKNSPSFPASVDLMSVHDFYAEALLLSNLHHPNVLGFEFIISEVSPYNLPGLATEYMSDNLNSFIRNATGLLSWNDIWSIARQVANGLKYLHSQKIVHFDIKSSNILLTYSGGPVPNGVICKVADFGLAMKNISGAPIPIYSQRGTTHYMAPEVIRTSHDGKQLVTEKVDVYSFGILLWELIVGKLPYTGKTDDQIENLVLTGTRPTVPSWCDKGWKWLMEACWREDPYLRLNFDQILDHFSLLLGAT